MANENLRRALERAGLTDEQFAEIVQVDPRTVQRWLSGRPPYRRHRARIARALDLTELELWPTPGADIAEDDEAAVDRPTLSAASVGVWTYLDDSAAPDAAAVITDGEGPIDVFDSAAWVQVDDQLASVLLQHAGIQRPVRILRTQPSRELLPLIGQPHIEVKIIDGWTSGWMVRVGETLLTLLDPLLDGDAPPLLVLEQRSADGLFTRLTNDFEELWQQHDNVLEEPDQLDDWLDEEPDEDERGTDRQAPASPAGATATAPPPDRGSDLPAAGGRRRRWPNRPG